MSKADVGFDEKFVYNDEVSFEENFDKWLRWTNRERRFYGQKERTREDGLPIFKSMHGGV
tara:strand:- start:348 stop:527 length:180 start_codon:yes stop_codon:yes gene_type:complete